MENNNLIHKNEVIYEAVPANENLPSQNKQQDDVEKWKCYAQCAKSVLDLASKYIDFEKEKAKFDYQLSAVIAHLDSDCQKNRDKLNNELKKYLEDSAHIDKMLDLALFISQRDNLTDGDRSLIKTIIDNTAALMLKS